MKIFVDLDGVIVDFSLPAMRKCGVAIRDESEYPNNCGWDLVRAINILRQKQNKLPIDDRYFWNSLDYKFWFTLKMYTASYSFLRFLEYKGEVYFATSPTLSTSCVAGKYAWVMKYLPDYRKKLFIGASKEAFASPDSLLIDDRDRNCERFEEAGGKAILVPRPWNLLGYDEMPLTRTIARVKELCD